MTRTIALRGRARHAAIAAVAAGAALLLLTQTPGGAGAVQTAASPSPQGTGSYVVVAAGDISLRCGRAQGWKRCAAERTAERTESMHPTLVLPLGDNQYDLGTLHSYQLYYNTTWGRFKAKSRPVPGNHESYDPSGASSGYRAYFGALATPAGHTYYSYDLGDWHLVALDSNLGMSTTSQQNAWLRRDLAANSRRCVLAYWHHPLYSSGDHGNNPASRPIWRTLLAVRADVVLNGHDHLYERFVPQRAEGGADGNGIRQFTVGTGGADLHGIRRVQPNSAVRIPSVHGVLKLTLAPGGYTWQFVQETGQVRDHGSARCHSGPA